MRALRSVVSRPLTAPLTVSVTRTPTGRAWAQASGEIRRSDPDPKSICALSVRLPIVTGTSTV